MSIKEEDVVVGGEYLTANNQLRLVTEIKIDEKKQERIIYSAKSAKKPNQPWGPGSTNLKPPPISKFAQDCVKRIK